MYFELSLNILWIVIGLAAFGLLAAGELCRPLRLRRGRPLRLLALLLAVIFLFPCVSASDDLLSFQALPFTLQTHDEVGDQLPDRSTHKGQPALSLERLFEGLQTFEIANREPLPVTLCAFALSAFPSRLAPERHLGSPSGRDPPVPTSPGLPS